MTAPCDLEIFVGDESLIVPWQALKEQAPRRVLRRPPDCAGIEDEEGRHFEGVALADILRSHVGLDTLSPDDTRCLAIIAHASDGYRCLFSWGELFNSPAGPSCLVALSCEDAPLAEIGPLALVIAADNNSGPRFVKNLCRIELKTL
ncbi:hypothetical protein DLREEDagrD3_08360 [Denitratisoma sp. agr-D3]